MRVKEICIFWNNLMAVFGLSILSNTSQSWKISGPKSFWAIAVTVLFSVWGFHQLTGHNSHALMLHENHPQLVSGNCTVIVLIIFGGNIIANWIRITYLIKTKNLIDLYERAIEFDEKYFGSNFILWKSHTFRFLFFAFFVLIAFIALDYFFIGDSREIVIGCYIYPAYFIVLNGQVRVFLVWIRIILGRIQNEYLMDLESVSVFYEDYTCKIPSLFRKRPFPLRIVRQARKLYHDLYLISRLVNEVFAGPVLLMLSYNLMLSIIYTYALIYNIRYKDQGNLDLFPLHWVLLSFAASLATIHPFHATSHKAALLVVDVQGLLTFDDERLSRELQEFAVQVQQEKMDFSPYGLFIIKNSLMPGMMGAVATYLVVFTQFDIQL